MLRGVCVCNAHVCIPTRYVYTCNIESAVFLSGFSEDMLNLLPQDYLLLASETWSIAKFPVLIAYTSVALD